MKETANSNLLADKLEEWFTEINQAVIALSGGIDSSLVAYAARKYLLRENTIAVISTSASLKAKELKEARDFCKLYDIPLKEIDAKEIEIEDYRNNPVNRCFFCKSALYIEMERLAADEFPGYTILNGNNFTDFGDFRPGLQAADDHKIRSPLAECGFTKVNIRELAQWYGLPNWNKPASPCLSSRFPYGENITVEKLNMVEKAEDLLNTYGFDEVRVRFVNNSARIEVPQERIPELKIVFDQIKPEFESFGFENSSIDEEGFVSGKLNREVGFIL